MIIFIIDGTQCFHMGPKCIVAYSHHLPSSLLPNIFPGVIKTDIARHGSPVWRGLWLLMGMLFFADVESGAQTTLHCALQEGIEPQSGRYFARCAVEEVSAKAKDDAAAKKLWELSERFCGL